VEGTAQGNYLRGWGLSVEKGIGAAQTIIDESAGSAGRRVPRVNQGEKQ
jgi:hypothetical protein